MAGTASSDFLHFILCRFSIDVFVGREGREGRRGERGGGGRRSREKESEKRENKGKQKENTRGKKRGRRGERREGEERKGREERAGGERPSNPPKAVEKTSMLMVGANSLISLIFQCKSTIQRSACF